MIKLQQGSQLFIRTAAMSRYSICGTHVSNLYNIVGGIFILYGKAYFDMYIMCDWKRKIV